MKIEQRQYIQKRGWEIIGDTSPQQEKSQLVLVFGEEKMMQANSRYNELKAIYPNAQVVYVSDAGTIQSSNLMDDSLISTALYFEKSTLSCETEAISEEGNLYKIGKKLGSKIKTEGLRHIFLFSGGMYIDGTELIKGLKEQIIVPVTISGGLAGDSQRFQRTFVGLNDTSDGNNVVVVCFYGENLQVGLGSFGGWNEFGVGRTITKSKGRTVYEIDGQPALDLYKTYLGDIDIHNSKFYLPIAIKSSNSDFLIVRTPIGFNETDKSVSFAGDVPEGISASLLKTDIKTLMKGARQAGEIATKDLPNPEFALIISCVGRRIILRERTEEGIEGVCQALGTTPKVAGFYSYGEFASPKNDTKPYLLNQTMTVTLFKET